MRTIVFANQGIGDVVMAFPLMQALHQRDSDRLLVVTRSNQEIDVARLAFRDDRGIEYIGLRDLGSHALGRFVRLCQLTRAFRPEAIVIPYGVDPVRGAMVSVISGAATRIGPAAGLLRSLFTNHLSGDMSAAPGFHKVDTYREAAAILGRAPPDRLVLARDTSTTADEVSHLLGGAPEPLIGIAVGSGAGERHKRLPQPIAVELVRGLRQRFRQHRLVLLGGPAEMLLNRSLAVAVNDASWVIDLTAATTVAQLIEVLRRCRVLVTCCNGISHLSALVGCPVVGFYGPTNPFLTGPYGVDLIVIRKGLRCSPCYTRTFWRGCGLPRCMELDVNEALRAVGRYLDDKRPIARRPVADFMR